MPQSAEGRGQEVLIIVASSGGRAGVWRAMECLRQGDSALDAVVAGIERAEGARGAEPAGIPPPHPPDPHLAPDFTRMAPGDAAGTLAAAWGHWRQQLGTELRVEPVALARMEWLLGLGVAALGPVSPGEMFSIVARDHARHIACGVSTREHGGGDRRVVLALRAGRALGDALREALADLDRPGALISERINLHALARDRIPLGASHLPDDTFLYLRAEMADSMERPCLYVA
jgi:hypothetical protein